MPAGTRVALALSLLALLGFTVAGAAAGYSVTAQSQPQVSSGNDDPSVTMVVDLRSNGNARWRVSTTFNLTSETERESFADLARAFENGDTSALGLEAFRHASTNAANVTGREMSIVDVDRDATVGNDTGRLTVAFTWTNFARTDGDRLHVDDVLVTGPDGGTWLPGLDPGDRLLVRAPQGYGVAAASTAPERRENRSVLEWTGPETFEASDLRAEFTGRGALTPTATPSGPGQSVPWPLVFALGLGGGVAVAYLFVHRDGFDLPPAAGGADTDGGTETAAQTAESPPDGTGPDAQSDEPDESDDIDETLLSDEERVERLLDQNGGRMKQATIVKETGWSNAKVSQLLSAMEDDGRIDKLRIGRENLISFPEEDVAEFEE